MKITTKKGDRGLTRLLSGRRVRKDHPRLEAVGALDELNSFLGLAKSGIRRKWIRHILEECQRDVFTAGSEAACDPRDLRKLRERIGSREVERLEERIESAEKRLPAGSFSFALPGLTRTSALLDVARCTARRAERLLVALEGKKGVRNPHLLAYFNRLSDLLWLLARVEEGREKGTRRRSGKR